MYRGDVYLVDLTKGIGSEQEGFRPCLIVQNDVGNKFSPTTIICPITKHKKKFDKTHVQIEFLSYPSTILCEQIRAIDKRRIKNKVGEVPEDVMKLVDIKILVSLGIDLGGV